MRNPVLLAPLLFVSLAGAFGALPARAYTLQAAPEREHEVSGTYHLMGPLAARANLGCSPGNHAFCRGTLASRLLNLTVLSIRRARLVEVNIGITPRNVRSEGVAPCKCSRLPNT